METLSCNPTGTACIFKGLWNLSEPSQRPWSGSRRRGHSLMRSLRLGGHRDGPGPREQLGGPQVEVGPGPVERGG